MEHILYLEIQRRIKMTFKEFKKMYDENKNIKYIKIIVKDVEKIFYARISEIDVEYEKI